MTALTPLDCCFGGSIGVVGVVVVVVVVAAAAAVVADDDDDGGDDDDGDDEDEDDISNCCLLPSQQTTFVPDCPHPGGILSSKATGEPSVPLGATALLATKYAIRAARRDAGEPGMTPSNCLWGGT